MDRTVRNTNMLWWNKELWLIDHGACLYFHHNPQNWQEQALRPFTLVKDHVLLAQASQLETVDAAFRYILTNEVIRSVVEMVPEEWLAADTSFQSTSEHREMYIQFLETRLANSAIFVKEARYAADSLI